MLIKCKVNIYPEKRKDKITGKLITENVPLFLNFSFSGKRMNHYTGYRINLSQWDADSQKVRRNCFNRDMVSAAIINQHLDELSATVREIYTELRINKKPVSMQLIRDELKKRIGEESKPVSFFDTWDMFVQSESIKRSWTQGTITRFSVNKNLLTDFQTDKHYKIEFDSINENFFNRYMAYLKDNKGHRNTTTLKNIKQLKWFLEWATKAGFNSNLYFRSYSLKLKGTSHSGKIIFLTWEELMNLYSMEIESISLSQVRDVFCFTCFSGLRYSDVYNLKKSNIKQDSIELTTVKTDDSLIINLNEYSRAIIDRYKDVPFKDDKALPVISNQKFNDYLKDLGKLAGLTQPETIVYYKGSERIEETSQKWELLSTHCGRKTFITNALFLNIPAEVIQSWTGHKDHRTMEQYFKIVDQQKVTEMRKFNNNGNDTSKV